MNKKFPILSVYSAVFRVGGLLLAAGGLVAAFHGTSSHDDTEALMGMFSVPTGLFLAAVGEIIGVLFAIEANTRRG